MVKVAENDNLSLPSLYERDFYAWANEQALALKKTGHIEGIDKKNIIEELESMGKSELRGLMSSVEQALIHLVKLSYSAATDPRSGCESVRQQRHAIGTTLADSPSLKGKLEEKYQAAWAYARKESLRQLQDVNESPKVPVDCPFAVEKVLDENYFPQVQNRPPKP